MSHNYSNRSSSDDFRLHPHMYSNSYQSESDIYRQRTRSAPQEPTLSTATSTRPQNSSVHMPGKAFTFLHSCGLEQRDQQAKHRITMETLPKQIFQIKERKPSITPSSWSSITPPHNDTSSYAWKGRGHISTVEYPLHRPKRPTYPLPPEQTRSWHDHWGDHQQTGSATNLSTGRKTSNNLDWGHSSVDDPYSKLCYTSAAPEASSTVSQSYGDNSRGRRQNLKPLHPVTLEPPLKVPTRKEASDFLGRVPAVFPYACILCDITVLSEKDWSVHSRGAQHANSQLELVEKYPQWDQRIESARRSECQVTSRPKYSETRDPKREYCRQEAKRKIKTTPENKKDWPMHIGGSHHANSQCEPRAKYPKWDHHIEPHTRSSESQMTPQVTATETRNKGFKIPTKKQASDFHGQIPPVFPYSCVLCNITVLSENDWSVHIRGALHANRQLELVEKYPDWNQHIKSAKRSECLETLQPTSTEARGGVKKDNYSNTKKRPNLKDTHVNDKGKVVCAKFAVSSVEEGYLKKLLGQFGAIVKVIMLPTVAFVEMQSKDQAQDIVKYFNNNPLEVGGKRVEFLMSTAFTFLQSSPVVSFFPLPAGDGIDSELKAIAKRFGSIKNSMFLPSRGYVEMTNPEDAYKLVEQYSVNPLKLKRTIIHVTFSSEYENLNICSRDHQDDDGTLGSYYGSKSGSERHISLKDPPSSERRHSAERASSSRTCSSTGEDDDPKSRERSGSSSNSSSLCSRSPAKDGVSELSECADVKVSACKDEAATTDSDSDLEGVEVIADDGEELQHDFDEFDGDEPKIDDGPEDNQKMDHEEKTCEASRNDEASSTTLVKAEQGMSSDVEEVKYSNRQQRENFPSDTTNVPSLHSKVQVKTLEGDWNRDLSKSSSSLNDVQIHKEHEEQDVKIEEEILENFITLDEFVEETSPDYKETDKLKPSTQETKVSSNSHNGASNWKSVCTSDVAEGLTTEMSNEPRNLRQPEGTEYIRPVVGYFCSLCSVIYSSEEEAKNMHCRSQSHHDKLKDHMHKSGSA